MKILFLTCLLASISYGAEPVRSDFPDEKGPVVKVKSLQGQHGYIWYGFQGALPRCLPLDEKRVASLAKAYLCFKRDASQSQLKHPFHECKRKAPEAGMLVFKDEKTCQEEHDTMAANAP